MPHFYFFFGFLNILIVYYIYDRPQSTSIINTLINERGNFYGKHNNLFNKLLDATKYL